MPRGFMGPRGFLTDEEKSNMPKVTKELLVRIFSYLLPYWWRLLLVFIIIVISSVLGLLPSIITGKIIDEAIIGNDMALLIRLCIMAVVALVASQVVGVLESLINATISRGIIYDMRNEMYAHLQQMPHSFFTSEKQGDIITRMNSDISGVNSVISNTLTNTVSNLATVVTTVVALADMNWQLALVGIIVIPLLVLPTKSAGKQRWQLLSESQAKNDELNEIINESLSVSGSLLIKLFTQEKTKMAEFSKVSKEVSKLSIKEDRSGKWFRVVMGVFTNLGPHLIYLVGGYLIIVKHTEGLSVGMITATVALVNRLYRPVESLLNVSVEFTRSMALFTRIFDYLDKDIAIKSIDNAIRPEIDSVKVTFEDVAFSYDKESTLLKHLSFEVPEGKMYAIVGPSGSGKSTIVNLIPRLYDVDEGTVRINGFDIRYLDLAYLRSQIGMVTQEAYLFNGTIRDNLLFGKPNATQQELEEACKIANIHDFILSQPDGYDTQVGNRGLKLSGGEKQRISIARVILKDPKLLILDEATSALDSISESSIQSALDVLMKGRTSIVIAHRLSTILQADKILVVADGKIVEQGEHEELMELNGVYRDLYETQFRKVIEMENAKEEASGC